MNDEIGNYNTLYVFSRIIETHIEEKTGLIIHHQLQTQVIRDNMGYINVIDASIIGYILYNYE